MKKDKKITEEGFRKYKESKQYKRARAFLEKFACRWLEMMQEDPIAFFYVCLQDIHSLKIFLMEKNLYSEWKKYNENLLDILENTTEEGSFKEIYQRAKEIEKEMEETDSFFDGFEN